MQLDETIRASTEAFIAKELTLFELLPHILTIRIIASLMEASIQVESKICIKYPLAKVMANIELCKWKLIASQQVIECLFDDLHQSKIRLVMS